MTTKFDEIYNAHKKLQEQKEENKMEKVFLGGTCNNSTWRERLIENLEIDYFNPVVEDWSPEDQEEEERQREECDYVLYVINPLMKGTYSIAEVVDDSNKQPEKTVFCILRKDDDKEFSEAEWKSLKKISELVEKNGGKSFTDLDSVADYLNSSDKKE